MFRVPAARIVLPTRTGMEGKAPLVTEERIGSVHVYMDGVPSRRLKV